jgi:Ca-activated chloride channel family protein
MRRALLLVPVFAAAVFAQGTTGLSIVSPTADTLLTGPVVLRAAMDAALVGRVQSLTFYADGKVVCADVPPTRPECAWNAGADVKPHVIRVVASLGGDARAVATVRTARLDFAESVRVDVVQVAAVVTDRSGHFVTGLDQNAFRLSEDGVAQPISHFAAQNGDLDLVLAVDASGSMGDALPDVKEAVRAFLGALGPRDHVTLIAFNDNMYTLASHETSAAARIDAVDRLVAFGGTALYDVVSKSIDLLATGTGRRAVVLFTDGDDRNSQATLASTEEKLQGSDATLFVVGLGRGASADALRKTLEDLADASGGRVLFAEKAKELREPFTAVVSELSNQYLIGFESTNRKRDGGWRTLKIETGDKRYRVRARRGYRAPAK